MAIERTFSMIKPDATKRNLTGAITKMLEDAGLRVVASRRVWMSLREAQGFYAVHKDRPFFGELTEFMSSGRPSCRFSKARMQSPGTVKSWAPPIRPTPQKVPSAKCTPCRSAKTPCTARMLLRLLPKRSRTGSRAPRSSADRAFDCRAQAL